MTESPVDLAACVIGGALAIGAQSVHKTRDIKTPHALNSGPVKDHPIYKSIGLNKPNNSTKSISICKAVIPPPWPLRNYYVKLLLRYVYNLLYDD